MTELELFKQLLNCAFKSIETNENLRSGLADALERERTHNARLRAVNERLGPWMSAALDDPGVCDAMKADINAWFDAHKQIAREYDYAENRREYNGGDTPPI